ncbi:hypothetical protein [Devosia sp.]|jgi:hypothetical protein|nr:hypothetical protein [Devosia sp.]MBN9363165.1 hypothetical protein [Devosia sp.]ODS86584.1 MAG: hypothetical protein ABS47_13905 [Devosia sp. SCN 66-27]OJX23341.1 MAG: hypothetical protein BGO83_00180 [Devosia sp. 66-14]
MEQPRTRRADPTGPTVFIAFSVIGVAYIIGAKALSVDAVMVTLVPVLLMIGYAVCIWLFKALRLRSDQSGDNFYYMGFIYTLTSLAVTLIQYADGTNAAEIIRNFGVAVASTIAGIVLRIVFNLFRRDPVEVEHESRLELSEAARRVRQELNGMLLEFSHFGRTQQQMALEAMDEYRARAEETTGTLVELLGSEAHVEAIARARDELEQTQKLLVEINLALAEIPGLLRHRRRVGFWRRLAFWAPIEALPRHERT